MNNNFTIENARDAIKKKDEKAAQSILSEIIKKNPRDNEAWILLAQVAVEPDQIIECLERVHQLDPEIIGLSQRLELVKKGPLKYYHQMIDITKGYGQWNGEARSLGIYEIKIQIKNNLVEINNLLTTLKKQRKHLDELLRIITEDKDSFHQIQADATSPAFGAEIRLYFKLSKYILIMDISQAVKQIERITLQMQINAEKKMKDSQSGTPEYSRITIPDGVKLFVWNRDQGRCVKCGSQINLEYDHIIPITKGGSNTARNIQLLCETCNRQKSDKIF